MNRLYALLRESRGTFTIEASFVMPIILICTLSMLFLALFVFQSSSAQYTAGVAADRAAFVWDNSRRNPVTGAFSLGEDDGLYWRLHSDSVSDLFSFMLPHAASQISLPTTGNSGERSPEGKLRRVGGVLSKGWSGFMSYTNKGIFREVSVTVEKPFEKPVYADKWLLSKVQSEAQAQVVDPVESIRVIDLARTFISEVKGRITPRAALSTFVEPKSVPEQRTVISSHASAAQYLRVLVSGTEQTILVKGTTERLVDALDANQVAHQTFYTFNESQLRAIQLPKDAELLEQGTQIKGVVWHFFKQAGKGVALSAGLRQELQRKGILVVVHE